MADAPLISTSDLADWLGETVDETRASVVVEAASAVVRSCITETYLDEAGELTGTVPDIVAAVTKWVAARAYRARPGISQETSGPFSHTYSSGSAQGDLYLTKNEKNLLGTAGLLAQPTGGALWTLGTTRIGDDGETDYRPVLGGGEAVPMFGPSDLGPPI